MIKRPDLTHAFIELYAGAGGSILGMINAGMKCIAAVEKDPSACWSLWHNLCMRGFSHFKAQPGNEKKLQKLIDSGFHTENRLFTHIPEDDWITQTDEVSPVLSVYCCDMLHLSPEQLMQDWGIRPRELGLISGGPPCQGFSIANNNRSEADPRNQHPFRFFQFVDFFQPRMFMMENVPGMLTLGRKKGEKEGPFPQSIRLVAGDIGYHFQYEVHNAMNYGVPQTRKRVIFVGIRNDLYESGIRYQMPEPTHTWNYHDALEDGTFIKHFLSGKQPYVNVQEAIGDLGKWDLSAWMDKDCINLPDGHRNRRGAGRTRKTDEATSEIRADNYIWYQDRFSGNWFKGNHRAEYGCFTKGEEDKMKHYMSCRWCGRLNLIIRDQCHACNGPLYPSLKSIYQLTGQIQTD